MARMILDYINTMIAIEDGKGKLLSYDEWCEIRRNGTPEEIEEAVAKMMEQGGYDNLA